MRQLAKPFRTSFLFFLFVAVMLSSIAGSETTNAYKLRLSWEASRHLTSVDQMQEYMDLIVKAVVSFDIDAHIVPPRKWVYIPPRGVYPSSCGLMWSLDAYAYCGADDTIYIGADMMWWLYQISWVAPAIAIAHESGHAQQHLVNPSGFMSIAGQEVVRIEEQADCVSGVWASWARSIMPIIEDEDLPGIINFWSVAADRNPVPLKTHGSFAERLTSYYTGLSGQNLIACDPIGIQHVSVVRTKSPG